MTRLWPQGEAIVVVSDSQGTPGAFEWQGRTHRVVRLGQRWRVDEGWWRQQVWREYFQVCTDTGLLMIVYRDLLTGRWYLQRLYD